MTSDDGDLRDLRVLDPAAPADPDAARAPAAQRMLAHILSQPRHGGPAGERTGEKPRRSSTRRWVAVGAAAAAAAIALVALPRATTAGHAYASWTPVPEEVAATEHAEIIDECWPGGTWLGPEPREATIVEERGRVTFLVFAGPAAIRHCLLVDGGMHSTGFAGDVFFSAEVAPDDAVAVMGVGSGAGADAYAAITGRVGEDVVAVHVHPRHADPTQSRTVLPDDVEATVSDGYFAAWWPGESVDVELTLTMELADGGVVSDIPAFEHDR